MWPFLIFLTLCALGLSIGMAISDAGFVSATWLMVYAGLWTLMADGVRQTLRVGEREGAATPDSEPAAQPVATAESAAAPQQAHRPTVQHRVSVVPAKELPMAGMVLWGDDEATVLDKAREIATQRGVFVEITAEQLADDDLVTAAKKTRPSTVIVDGSPRNFKARVVLRTLMLPPLHGPCPLVIVAAGRNLVDAPIDNPRFTVVRVAAAEREPIEFKAAGGKQ